MEVRLQQRELEAVESGFYRRCGKRAFDIAAAFVGLLGLSPLLVFCAILVRLSSRGPVFFRQVRLGQHGRSFKVFKFRTMRVGADQSGPSVVVPGDERLTPIGNLLRRTKLDELPQLINALLGDMSIVGPRPRVPEEVDVERAEERALVGLRPGITSYASIYHRMEAAYCAQHDDPGRTHRETVLPQKGYLDGEYLKNLSFSLDLKLILLTAMMVYLPILKECRVPAIVIEHDVSFPAFQRAYRSTGVNLIEKLYYLIEYVRLKRWELDALRLVDGIAVLSEADAVRLRAEGIKTPMFTLQPSFDRDEEGFSAGRAEGASIL